MMALKRDWTVVVFTVPFRLTCKSFRHQLNLLRSKGIISCDHPVLVVDDPTENIGSGGATLNALLVAAEYLSACQGNTVLTPDVLKDAKILVVHMGRKYSVDPCGRPFIELPAHLISSTKTLVRLNIFIHIYRTVTRLATATDSGLWISGSDAFLLLQDSPVEIPQSDIVAFCFPMDYDTIKYHGSVKLSEKGELQDIFYQATDDQLQQILLPGDRCPLLPALMYVNVRAADSLLNLHSQYPLTCCTYLGIDSGTIGLKLSIFFDFLLACCTEVNELDFVHGIRSGPFSQPGRLELLGAHTETRENRKPMMAQARQLIWDTMRPKKVSVVQLKHNYYHYLLDDKMDYAKFMERVVRWLAYDPEYMIDAEIDVDEPLTASGPANAGYLQCGNDSEGTGEPNSPVLEALFEERRTKEFWSLAREIRNVLEKNLHKCLLPYFSCACIDGFALDLLAVLDSIADNDRSGANRKRIRVAARTLSCIADVLSIMANGLGGLRSGPAAHPAWQRAYQFAEKGNMREAVVALAKVRNGWMSEPSTLIRAGRHYEAAAQILIRREVMSVHQFIRKQSALAPKLGTWCCAEAAARIDIAGGWSDTPPITYENGGAVLNMAIKVDGRKPIGARCRKIPDYVVKASSLTFSGRQELCFSNLNDMECYKNPTSPGSLICAVLVCAEVVDIHAESLRLQDQLLMYAGGGLEIESWSLLPHGSGLGTSSILAGCIIAAVWTCIGVKFDTESVLHAVLYIEQLLTTGGGWQDQVGGMTPGLKLGRFGVTPETAQITVHPCNLSEQLRFDLEARLLLVYTGKTRLAKNLLQEVIRNWYARKQDIVETVQKLVTNAEDCKNFLEEGNFEAASECIKEYWEQKKRMAPGSEPILVRELLEQLYRADLILAGWLAGAGGGGFLYLFCKQPNLKEEIEKLLKTIQGCEAMSVHEVEIDMAPVKYYQVESFICVP